jgi:hypothetical protein
MRASQGVERAVIGYAIFDMHNGDEYWLYQPVGESWPDQVECGYGSASDERFTVRRSGPPFGAAETMTENGSDYAFFGTLRGDRTENVLIDCPSDDYLVVASRAPLWSLLVAVGAGVVAGLLGLVLAAVTAVRRRTGATRQRAAATPRVRPSALWYLGALPFLLLSKLVCGAGLLGGTALGFGDSFEAPHVGAPRSGAINMAFRHSDEYLLYADVDHPAPAQPVSCRLQADTGAESPLPVQTDRSFGVPDTVTNGDRTYRLFGAFRLADPVLGTVTCDGQSTLLVRPSNRPQLLVWAGVGMGVGSALVAGAIATVVFALRRRSARATTAAAAGPAPAFRPG